VVVVLVVQMVAVDLVGSTNDAGRGTQATVGRGQKERLEHLEQEKIKSSHRMTCSALQPFLFLFLAFQEGSPSLARHFLTHATQATCVESCCLSWE